MKKSKAIFSILAAVTLAFGCKKQVAEPIAVYAIPDGSKAGLKVNYASVYRANPNVQIKVNSERVSNLLTARTPFPGGGYNTNGDNRPDYLVVTPGPATVGVSIPKAGSNADSVAIANAAVTLQAGKFYTLHTADTAANLKTVLVEDDATNAAAGFSKYRFINLMPDAPAIDLYFGSTRVVSNIAYLATSPAFTLQSLATAEPWTVRLAGADPSSTAIATYSSANTTLSTRSYTIFAMGYRSITSTSDARRPFVSFFLNR